MTIKLETPVRIFRRAFGPEISLLYWDQKLQFKGDSTIEIREPVIRYYDHMDKVALPLDMSGEELVVLFEELPTRNKEEVRKFFPNHPLLVTIH